jgi:hypothetical protein
MAQHRKYVGPHDEVELAATGQVVKHGEQIEVDADLAKALDQQPDNWAKPRTKAAKTTPSPKASPAEPEPVTVDGQSIVKDGESD